MKYVWEKKRIFLMKFKWSLLVRLDESSSKKITVKQMRQAFKIREKLKSQGIQH